MNKFVIALICLVLVACTEPAESTVASSNPNISVEKLLTVDGCTVYRFQDSGLNRYFSNCKTGHSEVTYQQNCGKNCQRPETISSN